MAKKVYRNEVELGTGGHKEILAARKKMKTKHEDGVEELLADFEGNNLPSTGYHIVVNDYQADGYRTGDILRLWR